MCCPLVAFTQVLIEPPYAYKILARDLIVITASPLDARFDNAIYPGGCCGFVGIHPCSQQLHKFLFLETISHTRFHLAVTLLTMSRIIRPSRVAQDFSSVCPYPYMFPLRFVLCIGSILS